jgi:hypothetical protein
LNPANVISTNQPSSNVTGRFGFSNLKGSTNVVGAQWADEWPENYYAHD